MQIRWHKKDSFYAEGRNGYMIMRGISVAHVEVNGYVMLTPINTRGLGVGHLMIPQHAIPELIKALTGAMLRVELPPDIDIPKK